jgi:hypoxanthine phosphoribosyltransferase
MKVFIELNGSFMVVSDFMKNYTGACELSFVKCLPMKGQFYNEVKELIESIRILLEDQ